jgi:hypothetical protein
MHQIMNIITFFKDTALSSIQVQLSLLIRIRVVLLRFGPQRLFVHLTRIQTRNDVPDAMSVIKHEARLLTYLSSASTSKPGTQSMSA